MTSFPQVNLEEVTPCIPTIQSSQYWPLSSTILTPAERVRVDAAGEGLYTPFTVTALMTSSAISKERRAAAVLVSVRDVVRVMHTGGNAGAEFPRVPTVALLTELESNLQAPY